MQSERSFAEHMLYNSGISKTNLSEQQQQQRNSDQPEDRNQQGRITRELYRVIIKFYIRGLVNVFRKWQDS